MHICLGGQIGDVVTGVLTTALERNTALAHFIKDIDMLTTVSEANGNPKSNEDQMGVLRNQTESVRQFLIKCGMDTMTKTNTGLTLLHIVAAHGHPKVMDALADELGAEPNAQDDKGWTPLHMAALRGHAKVVG